MKKEFIAFSHVFYRYVGFFFILYTLFFSKHFFFLFRLHSFHITPFIINNIKFNNLYSFLLFPFFFAALLAGTLRTYQKAGCDMEYISLSCPRGTSISIEVAQYGNKLKGKFFIRFVLLLLFFSIRIYDYFHLC